MDSVLIIPEDLRALSTVQLNQLWQDTLEEERRWAKLCHDLKTTHDRERVLFEACRSWWWSVHRVLKLSAQCQQQCQMALEPYPAQLMMVLARVTHDLGKGVVTELISDASKGATGRPYTWSERSDIAHAIFYIEACKARQIADKGYNQTVSHQFDVTKRAVQKWCKNAEVLCLYVPRPRTPESTVRLMLRAGERYSRYGRGAPSPDN